MSPSILDDEASLTLFPFKVPLILPRITASSASTFPSINPFFPTYNDLDSNEPFILPLKLIFPVEYKVPVICKFSLIVEILFSDFISFDLA